MVTILAWWLKSVVKLNNTCEIQTPAKEQSLGQLVLSQAKPSNPLKQEHEPDVLSQVPILEHSARGCTSLALAAISEIHAMPLW